MVAIEIDAGQLKRLADAAAAAGKKLTPELASALNEVTKKTEVKMGREIREHVALNVAIVKKSLKVSIRATPDKLQAAARLGKTKRLGLRHFGARQDKRGVSYKINKKGGRSRIEGAFMGPKPGAIKASWKGNVFVRVGAKVKMTKGRHAGRMRQPIQQRFGVSAYGAYAKNELTGPQVIETRAELVKQIDRRINLNVLRASGLVKT